MSQNKPFWLIGLMGILIVVLVPTAWFWPRQPSPTDNPWAGLPEHPVSTDHTDIITGPFQTGQEVTRKCLECHPGSSDQVMHTTHWTWESDPVLLPGREEPVTIGKKNQINNFCIGIQGNWKKCTTCHVGYGWSDADYDFTLEENVDCLACHADTDLYGKSEYGKPAPSMDLLVAAQSVAIPGRDQCGKCHFNGGGGNGVKHGDLDESLYFPSENLDVHMGRLDFICTDCHTVSDHQIKGSAISVTMDNANLVSCTDCHTPGLHDDQRINAHVDTVACQTCHIPAMALKEPTKVSWDWSTAGLNYKEDHYTYLKIKGSFVYEEDFRPIYLWDNGTVASRYILGDIIDPTKPTYINYPGGDISDPQAKIAPFKIHIARQPYDTVYNYLLQPVTAGEGGFWQDFNWEQALILSTQFTGLAFSGEYGFAETQMFWRTSHMVQPKENSLQCTDCHGENSRLDWIALGYPGDPLTWGDRFNNR